MFLPPILPDEGERLKALREYNLVDRQVDLGLDEIVQLASRMFATPIALVSLVDETHQFFAAKCGLDVDSTGRDVSFCGHALVSDDVLVVLDASLDARFADNPLVTDGPRIRFYAGAPLLSPQGYRIGTLCLIDPEPRVAFTASQQRDLKMLARLVVQRLEVRRLEMARAGDQARFETLTAHSPNAVVCVDDQGQITFWNEAAARMFGFTRDQAIGADMEIIAPKGSRAALQRVARGEAEAADRVEVMATRRDGSKFPIELSVSVWSQAGRMSFAVVARDISEQRASEEQLFRLANFDTLTGLPNRDVLIERLQACIDAGRAAAVVKISPSDFKEINSSLGHVVGDSVLNQISHRLIDVVRPTDTIARISGDDFAVLMLDRDDAEQIGAEVDRMLSAIAAPLLVSHRVLHIEATAGIARYPVDGDNTGDVLLSAALALYQAGLEGRLCQRFSTPALREQALSRRVFEAELEAAVEKGEFELFYQPQVRITDRELIGAEALIRWRHPTQGLLSPARFLPALESGPHAAAVADWVLNTACRTALGWREQLPDFRIGINLSATQLRNGNLGEQVRKALSETGLPAAALELEITETIILRHDETVLQPLRDLRRAGIGIAFDDFGTGYASLSMLKGYPLSRIKIDRAFVTDICDDVTDAAIVRALVSVAHSLRIEVIAEGVETLRQRDMLLACGCDLAQGYFYGKPMPAAEFSAVVDARRVDGADVADAPRRLVGVR